MRITAIEPQAREPRRLNVHVDGVFRLAVAAELAQELPLRVGARVTEELLHELEGRDEHWRARDAALRLLGYRARTHRELTKRLRDRGFTPAVVERCLDELRERGLIDDASFAESFVRDRVRFRPRGAHLLLQELRTRGVDRETARATLQEVWQQNEVDERILARRAAGKWSPRTGESLLRARRRLYNFLARRGFDAEIVRDVVHERLP